MINKRGIINGRLTDVITPDQYYQNTSLYQPLFNGIEVDGLIYPIKSKNDNSVGVYIDGPFGFLTDPSEDQIDLYKSDLHVVDFGSASSTQEFIEKNNEYRDKEREILTTPDNIFVPQIKEEDMPEMRALKEAVISKNIDIDKYAHKFDRFNNDKRLFNENTISMKKLKTTCDALDIKATLILEDKSSNVPNPMNNKIEVVITRGDHDDK